MSASADGPRKRKRVSISPDVTVIDDERVKHQNGVNVDDSNRRQDGRATSPASASARYNSNNNTTTTRYDPVAAAVASGRSSREASYSPGPSLSTAAGSSQQQQGSSTRAEPIRGKSASPHPQQQQQQRPSQPQANRPAMFDKRSRTLTKDTLEHSYFVVEPNDEFTREVGDWIWTWICNRKDIEVCRLIITGFPGSLAVHMPLL